MARESSGANLSQMRRPHFGVLDAIVAGLLAAVLVGGLIPPRQLTAEKTKLALARELPPDERAIVCRELPDEGQIDLAGVARWSGFDYECIVHGDGYGREVFVEVDTDSIVEITGV